MADPVIFPFQAQGHGEVLSAIKSMADAAVDMRRAVQEIGKAGVAAGEGVSRGAGAGRRGLTELQRIATRVAADQERAAKRASAAQEREARQAVAAANRAGKEQERAWARAGKEAEKAAERATNATKRSEEQRWREVERTARRIEKEFEREAKAAEHAEERKHKAAQRAEMRSSEGFLRKGASAAWGALGFAGGALVGLGRDALSTGIDLAGGAVRDSLETQRIANRVSINARMPGQEAADPTALRKEFERTAIATPGVSAADVGRATQAYVDLTGDLDTARSSMQSFATVASATGASVEDVATAAASFGKHFGVKTQEDVKKTFAILIAQGKGGAMTMHDMAAQMQRLAAAGKAFGVGQGVEGVAKLGGLLQVARSATGSPRMAATAVENIFRQLDAKSAKLGIRQYDKSGHKVDLYENLAQVVMKEGGSDIAAKHREVNKFFGAQGGRGANPLVSAYEDATHGKTGKDAQTAGHDAVLKVLQDAAKTATSWAEVEKDASQAQEDASAQLQGAWAKLEAAAGEKLAPALAKLAGQIAGGSVMDGFLASIKIAAAALEAFGQFAQRMGWVKGGSATDKQEEASKIEADARKKRVALAGEHGERLRSLTPEQRAQYDALGDVMDSAHAVWDAAQNEKLNKAAGIDKIKATTKWSGEGGGEEATDAAYRKAGRAPWTRHFPMLGESDFWQGITGETPEQRDIRHAGEGKRQEVFQQSLAKMGEGGGAAEPEANGSDKLSGASEKLSAAVDKLSAVSDKLAAAARPPGSVTGAPVAPGGGH